MYARMYSPYRERYTVGTWECRGRSMLSPNECALAPTCSGWPLLSHRYSDER